MIRINSSMGAHIYSMRYWYKGTKEIIPEKMKKKRTTENKKQKHHKPK